MIIAERHVDADPHRLWELVADVDNWADYLPTVTSISHTSGPERLAVGSRYAVKQPGLAVLEYQITAHVPGEGFTWMATSPGVRTLATHHIQTAPSGATLRLELWWDGPLAPVIKGIYGRRTDRYVQREADTFAALAEGRLGTRSTS